MSESWHTRFLQESSTGLRSVHQHGLKTLVTATLIATVLILPAVAQMGSTPRQQDVSNGSSAPDKIHEDFVVGRVKSVTGTKNNEELFRSTGISSRQQLVEMEILEGPLKGKTVIIPNEITDNPVFNIEAAPGKELILSVVDAKNSKPELNIADYHRAPVLFILGAIFLAAFLFFGGKNGFKSLVGLATAIGLIGLVLLPMSLRGFSPLISAAFICFASALVTIFCIGGFSKKSAAALLGTSGGVIIAGTASQLAINAAPLTGLSSEEAQILRGSVLSQPPIFFAGLLAAAMLIGALGVIMDVAISIASAVSEISQVDRQLNKHELYKRGMNVGRDIMGSMTSTLVLAYAGSALPLLLLMSGNPSIKLLNLDLVATEIASALTGSLGLVCTIPITALAAANLMQNDSQKNNKATESFAELDRRSREILQEPDPPTSGTQSGVSPEKQRGKA